MSGDHTPGCHWPADHLGACPERPENISPAYMHGDVPNTSVCPRCHREGDMVTAEGDVIVYACSFSDDPDWSVPVSTARVCEGWTAARGQCCGRPAKWRGTLTAGPQPEVRLFCGLHATTRMAGESWSFEWIGGAS